MVAAYDVLVATEVVETRIFGRVGVDLAGGVAQRNPAHAVLVASAKQEDEGERHTDGEGQMFLHDAVLMS